MNPWEFLGTKSLHAAINDDPANNLGTASILHWSTAELEQLQKHLAGVKGTNKRARDAFLDALAKILIHEAYNAKHAIWKARKDPSLPYGPQADMALMGVAMRHLTKAAAEIEKLGITYGLTVIPPAVHGRIIASIDDLAAGRRQLKESFPGVVHGKRKAEKYQKLRMARSIALAYHRHLGVYPTSNVGGPFALIFFACTNFIGLGGGRWGDYYNEAFEVLGMHTRK